MVDRLMEQARPLGVDMEGVNSDRTGMVQVSDTDSNISLFRSVLLRNMQLDSCRQLLNDRCSLTAAH